MAFPTTGVLDSFTRANVGPPPSASWSYPWYPGDGGTQVFSNQCRSKANYGDAYWNVGTFGPSSEVYCTISTLSPTNYIVYINLRTINPNSSTLCGYYIRYTNAATDTVQFYRVDDTVETQLGATISQDFSNGDGIGFDAVSSTLTAYRQSSGAWSSVGSRTDATYTAAGYIGCGANHGDARMHEWTTLAAERL